jgi:hypothetical protein
VTSDGREVADWARSGRQHRFQCIPDGYRLADKSLEGGDETATVSTLY